jgi:Mn-dependent DtxR family transcriptional regulator
MKKYDYTDKQGQYLAFIYYYIKLNRIAPAERDIQKYFRVTAPSVNSMVKKLEELKFIERIKGKGRSITLLIERSELPDLD